MPGGGAWSTSVGGFLGGNIDYSRSKLSCSGAAVEYARHPALLPVAVGSAGLVGGYPTVVAINPKRGDEPAGEFLDTDTTPAPQQAAPLTRALEPIASHEHPEST